MESCGKVSAHSVSAYHQKYSPDALQVHRTDLDDIPSLLTLEDTVTTPTSHACDIEQLGAIDHVIIFSSSHANAVGFDLKAETAFVFPQGRRHSRLHPMRRNLT